MKYKKLLSVLCPLGKAQRMHAPTSSSNQTQVATLLYLVQYSCKDIIIIFVVQHSYNNKIMQKFSIILIKYVDHKLNNYVGQNFWGFKNVSHIQAKL